MSGFFKDMMKFLGNRMLYLFPYNSDEFKQMMGTILTKCYDDDNLMKQLAIGPDNVIEFMVLRSVCELLMSGVHPRDCSFRITSSLFNELRYEQEATSVFLKFSEHCKCSKEDVHKYFQQSFGPIKEIYIPVTNFRKEFGYVSFCSVESAARVLLKVHYICGELVKAKPHSMFDSVINK